MRDSQLAFPVVHQLRLLTMDLLESTHTVLNTLISLLQVLRIHYSVCLMGPGAMNSHGVSVTRDIAMKKMHTHVKVNVH